MSAAARLLCCCPYHGEIRLREDAMCPIHGLDQRNKERHQLEGQILACAEGLRDARSEAMSALHFYRRTKRRLIDLRKRMEAM